MEPKQGCLRVKKAVVVAFASLSQVVFFLAGVRREVCEAGWSLRQHPVAALLRTLLGAELLLLLPCGNLPSAK